MNASPVDAVPSASGAARTVSLGEELLWQAEQMGKGAPAFFDCPLVLPFVLRLRGHLDAGALHRSLDEVVRRHEVLRSVFSDSETGLVRAVVAAGSALKVVDLRHQASTDTVQQAIDMIEAELHDAFRADQAPLFRPRLYSLSADDHVLAFLVHHIVFDGWSRRVLARDLEAIYAAELSGALPAIEPLSARYTDYVSSQEVALPDARRRQLEEYWNRQLLDAPVVDLTDRGDAGVSTVADELVFAIPESSTARVRLVAREHKVTLATALLTLFAGAVRQMTGGHDLVLGMPISDRRQLEFEPLIGLFANTLVLRLNLVEASGFAEAAPMVQRQMRSAIAHQDLHYARLLRGYSGVRQAPFRVLFNFIPVVPGAEFRLLGLEVTEVKVTAVSQSLADLTFHISDRRTELVATIVYQRASFSRGRIEELATCFKTLLSLAVEDTAVQSQG